MKNKEFIVVNSDFVELSIRELISIDAGGPLSDLAHDVCYFTGVAVRLLAAFSSGATKGSANRFA
jgi:hypothetical protein